MIRRVKPYNQNADRRDDEVIAFDWPCPLSAQSGHPQLRRTCLLLGSERTPLARPKTSSGGLVHQIAQLIWTIEKVAVSGARLLRRQVELIDIQLEQINEVGAERRFSGLICNRVHGHLPTRRKLLMMIMGGRAVALPDGCQAGIRAANTTNNASTLKVSVGPQISCAYFGIAASRNSEFIRNHLSLRSHSICEAVHTPCVRRREIDKNVMPVTPCSWRLGFQLNEGSVGYITCSLLAHNSALGG